MSQKVVFLLDGVVLRCVLNKSAVISVYTLVISQVCIKFLLLFITRFSLQLATNFLGLCLGLVLHSDTGESWSTSISYPLRGNNPDLACCCFMTITPSTSHQLAKHISSCNFFYPPGTTHGVVI